LPSESNTAGYTQSLNLYATDKSIRFDDGCRCDQGVGHKPLERGIFLFLKYPGIHENEAAIAEHRDPAGEQDALGPERDPYRQRRLDEYFHEA